MKITIQTVDKTVEFDGTGVSTDEHNNLEVTSARGPLGLFNKDHWESALYGEEADDDGED